MPNAAGRARRCYHVAMLTAQKVIHAKRDGAELGRQDIRSFVAGVADGSVTDAQLGAFTMAVCRRGMNMAEQAELTLAMRDSGEVLEWLDIDGPVLDKHSTGGVGDMVSLILAPLVAACGGYVPMISGRSLGHTGGTLDKLESIPGLRTELELRKFRRQVSDVGAAIIGQTRELAPADRRIYATRDLTSTVESIPLIVSSILSKKLAEGLDALVLDVKTGNGAFMRDRHRAHELAANISAVAAGAGLSCTALVTDMNQPLAWSAGNALEIREVLGFLAGRRHPRLEEVVLALGGELLQLGGLAGSAGEAASILCKSLDSGRAAERFIRMVVAQGGPSDLFERRDHYLPRAPVVRPVVCEVGGFVAQMDVRSLGATAMRLGGERSRAEDTIDTRVGLSGLCSVGEEVEPGSVLAVVHGATEDAWNGAEQEIRRAIGVTAEQCAPLPRVYERISEGTETP
jgi:thymidine phosphorylase